jgi:hypothetical protein
MVYKVFEKKKADVTSRISSRPLQIAKRRACSKHVRLLQAGLCGYGVGCGDGLGHSDQRWQRWQRLLVETLRSSLYSGTYQRLATTRLFDCPHSLTQPVGRPLTLTQHRIVCVSLRPVRVHHFPFPYIAGTIYRTIR